MKVSQEVSRLDAQVEELEEKCQRPASELLQVRQPTISPPCGTDSRGFHRKRCAVLKLEGDGERQERKMGTTCIEKGWGGPAFYGPKDWRIPPRHA